MSGRKVGGIALLALAAFMLFGFLRSDASLASPRTLVALLITVALPAAGGLALLGGFATVGRRSARTEELRRRTIEAEILRLAREQGGKLTAVEVATALALPPESAKAVLDSLAEREIADLEITDKGVIVYSFHDVKHADSKHTSRGILDA